jgi:hypothetical protein
MIQRMSWWSTSAKRFGGKPYKHPLAHPQPSKTLEWERGDERREREGFFFFGGDDGDDKYTNNNLEGYYELGE